MTKNYFFMLKIFKENIRKLGIDSKKDTILLAVSGGVDSMVMVELFIKSEFLIGIAHVDHNTREGDSKRDKAFVEKYCKSRDIPFYSTSFNFNTKNTEQSNNFQEAARDFRYNWMKEIMSEYDYNFVATGHHLDDNIETFLYRISRGVGLESLGGISDKTDFIIRPLLSFSKEEVLLFAKQNSVKYVEDCTNQKDDYDRNFIRHNIVPQYEKMHSNFKNRISTTIENLKETNILFEFLLESYFEKYLSVDSEIIRIDKKIVSENEREASLALYFFLKKKGFNKSQVNDIISSIDNIGRVFYSSLNKLLVDRKELIIKPKGFDGNDIEFDVDLGEYNIDNVGVLKIEKYKGKVKFGENTLYLNGDKLSFPLKVRKWKAGDTFQPYGLKGKSKKIKTYLTDKKINRFEKEEIFVLVSAGEICAVIEQEISYGFRIDKSTENIVAVRVG